MEHAIHSASREGDLVRLREALNGGVNPSLRGKGGNTPLHYAAFNAHLEAVRELLTHGADISIENNGGCTPLECMDITVVYVNEDLSEEDFCEIQKLLKGYEEEIKEPQEE